jgi:hypothetical protein
MVDMQLDMGALGSGLCRLRYISAQDEIRAHSCAARPTGGESLSSHSGGVRNYEK